MASVLVVEDEPGIRAELIALLTAHGHVVRSAADGFGALREVTQAHLDAIVLDLGLPDLDGADALRMIRGISQVPVVVATARDDDAEIIALLDAGADDYLVKPFSGGQLAARLGAVLRRSAGASGFPAGAPGTATASSSSSSDAPPARITVGGLEIDPRGRVAHLDGAELQLTRREFDLLAYLARYADQVVPKRQILLEVWREPYVDDQTIDVHLSALRRKLGERGARPRYLQTVRGVGIKLVTPR
ncbi:response regulator transcription factor [Kitasatospora sp. NPDC094015]|uniref:response regulator transcription factor n=1 Tax=Kitasatospora sp. NPDC094015 TaxID=3155205 RepID=UPI00331B0BF1